MAARKLTTQQVGIFREFAATRADQGKTSREISIEWNETHPAKNHMSPRATLYHLLKMREQHLKVAEDHVAAITSRVVARLAAVASADPRAVVTWEGKDVKVRDSTDLTEGEAAQLAIKVVDRDGSRTIEISLDPSVRVRAGRALLTFLHGSRVSVTESGAIISRLTQSGDREGLGRIASGEDPIKVLLDRAPFLRLPDDSDDE